MDPYRTDELLGRGRARPGRSIARGVILEEPGVEPLQPHGHGAGTGMRMPRPPGFKVIPGTISAPSMSPQRMRRVGGVGIGRGDMLASDDFRLPQLRSQSFQIDDAEGPDEVVTVPLGRQLTGHANIPASMIKSLHVYVVQQILPDRVIFRSLGVSHNLNGNAVTIVRNAFSTFNGVSMSDIRVDEILKPGDHIVIDKFNHYYDKNKHRFALKADAISFPARLSDCQLNLLDRWISVGTVKEQNSEGQYLIDTNIDLDIDVEGFGKKETLMVRAVSDASTYPIPIESPVFVRAGTRYPSDDGWGAKAASRTNSPWQAESVSSIGIWKGDEIGVRHGWGRLKKAAFKPKYRISAAGFGWVLMPDRLLTNEMEDVLNTCKERNWLGPLVNFTACIFCPKVDKKFPWPAPSHWIATEVRLKSPWMGSGPGDDPDNDKKPKNTDKDPEQKDTKTGTNEQAADTMPRNVDDAMMKEADEFCASVRNSPSTPKTPCEKCKGSLICTC